MEEEEILESAEGQVPAEVTSTPEAKEPEVEAQAAPVAATPSPAPEQSDPIISFLDPDFLKSLEEDEIPEAEVVAEPEAEPEPEAISTGTHQPQQEVEQAAVETKPAPTEAKEGWPNLSPAAGTDIWGNPLIEGTPMIRVKNEETGRWELEPADPETGLTLLSEDELNNLKASDPDLYIEFMQEAKARKERLGQSLQESRKSEVVQTQAKLKQNGMPENVISAIHTRAEQMLQPLGGWVAPGVYQQAILGATAEMLAYGGDGLLDLARAIIANHEGQAQKPVEQKPAPKPVAKPAPARLATGSLGSVGAAAPARVATKTATVDERVSPEILRELNRIGMSVEDYLRD